MKELTTRSSSPGLGQEPPEADDQGNELSRLFALVEQAPDGIFVADLSGRYTDVNDAGCRMLGYTRAELIGKTIEALIPPHDKERLWKSKERMLRGRVTLDEWTLLRKDGSSLPVEVSARILPDGRWQGIVRDVTERKQAEEMLRLSNERIQLALAGADLATWDWNIKTGEVIFNERWAQMRGFRADEIRPHVDSWTAGVHPDDWPRVQKALADHFDGLTDYVTEHRVRTRAGGWIWVQDRGRVFERDGQGRATRMLGTELDITAQKQTETEQRFLAEVGLVLSSSLEYEDTLARVAQLAVKDLADYCIIDIVAEDQEVERLKVASRDPAMLWLCDSLSRIPLDRKRRHMMSEVLASKQPVLLQHVYAETVQSFAQSEEHLRCLQAMAPASFIAAPLLAQDKLLGVIAFVSSSASRTYGARELRLAEELGRRAGLSIENARLYRAAQRAIKARDDVLAVVAHDLRNPLHSIVALSSLVRDKSGPGRATAEILAGIRNSAMRMNQLIQDLLNVALLDAGQFSVNQEPVAPATILGEVREAQNPILASSALTLSIDVTGDLPHIRADRSRLLQVFENLVGNAVKFTKPGGQIVIGAAPHRDGVVFRVSDTGAGIPPEHLSHVFDRFWQPPNATRRGAGLGLAIVKGIVEAHGGRVWVDSEPGHGTSFFFTIPKEG